MSDIVMSIPIAKIQASKTNPRKTFDGDDHDDLVASIREKGVLYPILCRPIGGEPAIPMITLVEELEIAAKSKKALQAAAIVMVVDIQARAEKLKASGSDAAGPRALYYEVLKPLISAGDAQAIAEAMAPDAGDGFELVDGERRFRAAKAADLEAIPSIVRPMTDDEVLDAQLISFDQKKDIRPSERAAAYLQMHKAGRSPVEIATKLGRSVSFVREQLLFPRLSNSFLSHVDSGLVPPTTALVVARLPAEASRRKVELCVLQNERWAENAKPGKKPAESPLSLRETKHLIQSKFQIELKGCPFDQADAELLPAAGSCKACPKRAGNAGEDFKDVRADMCLDPECYHSKIAALRKQEEAAAKSGVGPRVMSKAQAAEVFSTYNGGLNYNAPFMSINEPPRGYDTRKTLRSVLGAEASDKVVVGYDRDGKRHEVVPIDVAKKALKDAGIKSHFAAASAAAMTPKEKAERAKQKEQQAIEERAEAILLGEVATAAEADLRGCLVMPPKSIEFSLRMIVENRIDSSYGDYLEAICKRRGIESTRGHYGSAVRDAIKAMGLVELFGLLVEISALDSCVMDGSDEVAKAFTIDIKAIKKRAADELRSVPSTNGTHANGVHKPKKRKAVPV